jgi:putative Mg2+ transporter-C (MgtC) family protein
MSTDPSFQLDMATRLVVAALLGGVMGLEREMHGHQAGMRTHMLVALGASLFTILSIYGFPASLGQGSSDPSRIAAQIVTGIGFLGAGAIIKYGTNIRGLTTAASLWVVAAVGLAAGAGAWLAAVLSTVIAVVALWPLHVLAARLQARARRAVRLRLRLRRLESLAEVSEVLLAEKVPVANISSHRVKSGHQVDIDLRLGGGASSQEILRKLESLPGVSVQALVPAEDA